ncbi:MAG: FG-GAP-like repeat-containing protein [Candidatus Hydrogenedentes bacterium]|nr:FG-GAP-like repeat-containing protein [Candidatus Hydrogenedentota bacterium]
MAVPQGTESAPVWRIYGREVGDFYHIPNDMSLAQDSHAVGDIDGDGYDDLVIARAPDSVKFLQYASTGQVLIFFGGPDREGTLTDLRTAEEGKLGETILYHSFPPGGYPIHIARHPAIGDFNGDGIGDIVIPVDRFNHVMSGGPDSWTGAVIVYGGPCLREKIIDLRTEIPCHGFTQLKLNFDRNPADPHFVAWVKNVRAGDINGDGISDILISSVYGDFTVNEPGETPAADSQSQHVVFGSPTLGASDINLLPEPSAGILTIKPKWWMPDRNVLADINGDGLDDIVSVVDVQLQKSTIDNAATSKRVDDATGKSTTQLAILVVYGKPDFPGQTLDLSTTDLEDGLTLITSEANPERFAEALTSGDFNGDGYCDLSVSNLIRESDANHESLYILFGGPNKIGVPIGAGSFANLDQMPGATGETRIVKTQFSDHVADSRVEISLGMGDFNSDGYSDLLAGERTAYVERPLRNPNATGRASVMYGGMEKPGLPLGSGSLVDFDAYPFDVRMFGTVHFSLGYYHPSNFGSTFFAGGDMNRDGFEDLAVLAPTLYAPFFPDVVAGSRGAIFIIFGGSDINSTTYLTPFAAGAVAPKGIRGAQAPVSRMFVGFDSGSPGTVTGTVTRSNENLSGIGSEHLDYAANVYWKLETDRANWSAATLRFQYTDDEIANANEYGLKLFSGPSTGGPWTEVQSQTFDYVRNLVEATVPEFGYFALLGGSDDVAPRVQSISLADANPSSGPEVRYRVRFSEPVSGVDISDFAVNVEGLVNCRLLEVTGSDDSYDVRIQTGWGAGTIGLNVLNDNSIADAAQIPLTASFDNGPHYTVNRPAANTPHVHSITRMDPTPTSQETVRYEVVFDMLVQGVDITDFELHTNIPSATILDATAASNTFHLSVYTGSTPGTIRLDVRDNDSILNGEFVPLGGVGAGNGDFTTGEIYATVAPAVNGITRASVNPTASVSVDFYVSFSVDVIGVDETDFTLTTTGITGARITGISGNELVSIVTVSTGEGDGTLKLNLIDDDSIQDFAGRVLGGPGAGNGTYTNGSVYNIVKSNPNILPPVVNSIARIDENPTRAVNVQFLVSFSEAVTGVDEDDFTVGAQRLFGSSIMNVAGSGVARTVTVATGNGSGTLRLNVGDNDSIRDIDDNPLGGIGDDNGNYNKGEVYNIERGESLRMRPFRAGDNIVAGSTYKVRWTSGAIGKKVGIELWRNGRRVTPLVRSTLNDGEENVRIPNDVAKGAGYAIRVISKSNPSLYTETKKAFTIH